MVTNTHDRKVRKIANDLRKMNWKVKADIGGYDMPDGIGKKGYIPDIIAIKGGRSKIIEVDTPNTENTDQLSAFRRSAAQRKNTVFEQIITRPRKKK